MIDLSRRDGRPLRIGHRGAPGLAPANTIAGLCAAVAAGVDLVELDVVAPERGPLVVAHSLAEARENGDAPTIDRALAFFADEAPLTGIHLDLKLTSRLDEVAAAIARHGLEHRVVVSTWSSVVLRAFAREAGTVRLGLTYPHDRVGLANHPTVAAGALAVLRATAPRRLERLIRRTGATAVMLQHRLVTRQTVAAAHALGAAVLAWTVDEADDLDRVDRAGVDGVITNDPRLFDASRGTGADGAPG